ncbi:hypothetical protein [Rhodopila sp.]|uniref:hypothetical protein n=1 Tax=Rhodopila sp. TaxID=2480087 RepID=UPI003D11E581
MTAGAVQAAAGVIPEDVPIVMLNMLRYREHADYGDRTDVAPCSGREAFLQRYSPLVRQIMGEGSRLVWLGHVLAPVVAPADEPWDDIALVEYPSFAAFRRLTEHPRYLAEAAFHRTAALEDSRLIAMVKAMP